MKSGFANAFTAVLAGTEAVCRDKQSILQSLRSPMVNVWKRWSDGSFTNDLKIEMKILKAKMKMGNVMRVQIKTKMLNGVAKCRGSVTGESDPIFLSSCFSVSILSPVEVFAMVFTSSAFAVTSAFVFVNNVTSLFSSLTCTSVLSLLISLFEFSPSHRL